MTFFENVAVPTEKLEQMRTKKEKKSMCFPFTLNNFLNIWTIYFLFSFVSVFQLLLPPFQKMSFFTFLWCAGQSGPISTIRTSFYLLELLVYVCEISGQISKK